MAAGGAGYDEDRFWRGVDALAAVPQLTAEAARLGGSDNGAKSMLDGVLHLAQGRKFDRRWLNWRNTLSEDRNEIWMLQQWLFVREFAHEFGRHGTTTTLRPTADILNDWFEVNLEPAAVEDEASLAWHDHSTALRLLHLLILLHQGARAGADLRALFPRLPGAIMLHLALLLDEGFYSVGTNHGFDQAYALVLAGNSLDLGELGEKAREVGKSRLMHEVGVAFNGEGVHIENSPTYHVLMMSRVLRAERMLAAFGASDEMASLDETLARAVEFLTHAVRPDGAIPLFGDSESLPIRINLDPFAHVRTIDGLRWALSRGGEGEQPEALAAVYPEAGYAFMRDRWIGPQGPDDVVHLAMKCGCLSAYHRHDDDNSLVLWAWGEAWLLGSGIYKYHEQDPHRRYLRSAAAQNVLSIPGAKCLRNPKMVPSRIAVWETAGDITSVTGDGRMYQHMPYRRRLSFDRAACRIDLDDRIEAPGDRPSPFELRFHLPADREIVHVGDLIVATSPTTGVRLEFDILDVPARSVEILKAVENEPLAGWWSPARGKLQPASTIVLRGETAGPIETRCSLRLVRP